MRILMIRTSALGDVVHALPVLRALRRHYPEAHISWVMERWIAPLLVDHPDLDERIEVSLRAWRRLPWPAHVARWWHLRRQLREVQPDIALDLMGNHKAAFVARLSGCRRRVGLRRQDRREPASALWINSPVAARGEHAVDRMLSPLRALGLPDEEPDFGGDLLRPPLSGNDEVQLAERPSKYTVILPGAGWGNKTWPPQRWGAVARRLEEATELPTLVPAGPGEEGMAQVIANAAAGSAKPLGIVSLPALVPLLRDARIVLGGDTGPAHLAQALGTPTVMVHGPTDPARHGPWSAPTAAVVHRLPCSFCHKRFDSPKACLLRISPHQVTQRALELLASSDGESLGSRGAQPN